jgi:hypothetical protein
MLWAISAVVVFALLVALGIYIAVRAIVGYQLQPGDVQKAVEDGFSIIKTGFSTCLVCSPYGWAKTIALVNLLSPTGIRSHWQRMSRKDAKEHTDGGKSYIPCEDHPKTHRHYLLVC